MNKNYLNPAWLASRLLERTGVAKTYQERVELAAHVCAGFAFPWVFGWWGFGFWCILSLLDEFVFDGYKGKDTWVDLATKFAGPVAYIGKAIWILCR